MFIYTTYNYLKAQVYAHIRYWIYRGDFDEADMNDRQEASDVLKEILSSSMYEFNHDYEFDNMVSLARYTPSFRDILEEVSPAYTSTIDDRGFFVYSVLCELFKKVFMDDFEEFRFIWNRRKKNNEKV